MRVELFHKDGRKRGVFPSDTSIQAASASACDATCFQNYYFIEEFLSHTVGSKKHSREKAHFLYLN